VIRTADPKPTEGNETWRLGSLGVEARGTIAIRGTFTGALGTTTAVQVVGTYRPASFASDFETLVTKVLAYTESVLDGALTVPPKVLPGDDVTILYEVKNTGEDMLEGLIVRVKAPEGFEINTESTATGTISGREIEVPIGDLLSGSSTRVELMGTFAAGVSGDLTVSAETGRKSETGEFLAAERSEATVTVLAGDLALRLVVNGQDSELKTSYGGLLRMAARYENTAPEDLHEIELRLILEPLDTDIGSRVVEWDTYTDTASGTPRNSSVTWNEKNVSGLQRLLPREDGGIDISIDGLSAEDGESGFAFRAYLVAEIGKLGDTNINRVVKSAPVVIRYVTDASIASRARYFLEEGAPVGNGPLPPVIGQKTTYRIEWIVTKSFHELSGLTVRAPLSKIAAWDGNTIVNAGDLKFNDATREVTWTLNRMPEDIDEVRASFDVTITPSEADANRFAKILGDTAFEAKDVTADYVVIQIRPEITSDLREDEYAEGKGVVREAE